LFSFISVINFNIYREWGSKISYKVIDIAIHSPNEALASSASSPILLSLFILFSLMAITFFISKLIINYEIPKIRIPYLQKCIISILVIGLTFLSIRGGLKTSPINQSMAYFSNIPFLNHAAVNTEWNLLSDILDSQYGNKNPYLYYSTKEAKKIVNQLYQAPKDTSVKILNTQRPNIVLIILESFTADVIESLGGEKGVAPNMEKLIKEGLLFDRFWR
jgi:phosphoglycerol transferase MdoB-like AlkP superfamily enzyme